ncbi:hypothetical protein HYU96_01505 [Candidatus Daviesbacteria bacterium]|nr:hypothetical protein [Candidatus Daviesbacteria bacterium]
MEEIDASAQIRGETAVSKDVESAYGQYLKAFQDRLRAAGLSDNVAETVEAHGYKLGLEITPQTPLVAFYVKEVLPDSLQDLPQTAYGFPVAITKILLGRRDAVMQIAPESLRETPRGRGIASATNYGDAIHPGRSTKYPNQVFANEIRFSLEGGVMHVGTFSSPSSQRGFMSNEDATWTSSPLTARQIIDFGQFIQYGGYLKNAKTRIVVDRASPLSPLDIAVPGFTALK